MTHEDPFSTSPPSGEQTAHGGRFDRMLHDPNLRAQAERIGRGVGGGALQGALENAGLVRGDGSLRKVGVAKAVLRPTHTARKAATGAYTGGRQAVKNEAKNGAAQLWQQTQGQVPTTLASQAERSPDSWDSAPAPTYENGFPLPATSTDTDPFGWPGETAAPPLAQPDTSTTRRGLFRRKQDNGRVMPAPVTTPADPFGFPPGNGSFRADAETGFPYPSAPASAQEPFTGPNHYPTSPADPFRQ